MNTYSIIKKSQLEGSLRLDAEYYQPEYLEVAKILKSIPHKNFNEVVSDIINGDEIREYVDKDGLPYLRVSDIKEFFIDLSSAVYISNKSRIKQNIKLKEGDILLSRSGSLAISAVATPDLFNSVISSHLMRISTKNINPYFLVAFLNSKFGKNQIMQRNNGAVVPEINHSSLRELLVPIFSEEKQKEIENLVKSAHKQNQERNKIYFHAENLFLEELGLKDFKYHENLYSLVNLSDVKKANRIDAEYFQDKYQNIFSKIKTEKLGNLVSMKKGFEPGSEQYQENGKLFIRVSSISKEGIIDKDQKYLRDGTYKKLKKDFEPQVGEILLTKDATPGIAYVIKEPIEAIICSGILRLNAINIKPEYLAFCINSIIGKSQVEKESGGSIIAHWKPEQVKNLRIPILPISSQEKISDLVIKSYEARKKAKELLEESKRKVEELIEGK